MKKAKIVAGIVDSISFAEETDPAWIDCPDDVFAGHNYGDGVFTPPPPAQRPTPAEITAQIDALVDADMETPLVQTILSNPPNEAAFRAALQANHRAKL